jgi:hypothetical protein
MSEMPISPLRARMIEDMSVRKFGEKTQKDYIQYVKTFSTFLGRSPATATGEDLRRYQVHQSKEGVSPATMNSSVAALRFFFRVTLNHPELGRALTLVPLPQRLRVVLSSAPGGGTRTWDASRGFVPWRLSNASRQADVRVARSVRGPASETRHRNGREHLQQDEWIAALSLLDHLAGATKEYGQMLNLIALAVMRQKCQTHTPRQSATEGSRRDLL